ncbi:MAG: anthranilate phosphoribosyltransferase [Pseudomonadales bacterium]
MNIQQAIAAAVDNRDLSTEEMIQVMRQVMRGEVTPAQIGGLLVALRMKGESIDEITGAVQVMRELSRKVSVDKTHLVDTCGTGGDSSNLFNVSTAAAFVVAAAGGRVAKHGNRSVSSFSGSSDVLEKLGVPLDLTSEQVGRCIDEVGLGFMFAPAHHGAMKHAMGPRRELALRTIFNMLGPMTNPAGVTRQVIGVFSETLCRPMVEVLKRLGSEHVLVLHARDGLDEISIAAETVVAELKDGAVTEYSIRPEDLGIENQSLIGLTVDDAEQSLALIRAALSGADSAESSKAADMIALNGGAALYVSGVADDLLDGVKRAQDVIGSGQALEKINHLATFVEAIKALEKN